MQMLSKICVGKEWRKGGKEKGREGGLERGQKEMKRGRQTKQKKEKGEVGEQKRGRVMWGSLLYVVNIIGE